MKQEDKLKEVAGKGSPFSVPDNYFESFKTNLIQSIPEYPEKPVEKKLSAWQKFRPYIYLAAMFAGIWLMMNIFHKMGGLDSASSNNSMPSTEMARNYYESDSDSYDLYMATANGGDIELEDEITDLYASIDDFKKDFNFYAKAID